MNGRCRLFHDWSAWRVCNLNISTDLFGSWTQTGQERTCNRCGKLKTRRVR